MSETGFVWPDGTRPASVYHLSDFIAEAAQERGLSIWALAALLEPDREKVPEQVLAIQLYSVREPGCLWGDFSRLSDALGLSVEFLAAVEQTWRTASADQRSDCNHARDWFEFGDDE
jgi:hypothetical protein